MATQRQIEANRRYAAKSTGPRTPAGRAKASRNSLRHGLSSRTVVLEGESLARYHAFLTALKQEFQPQTEEEFTLIDRLAVARERKLLLWAIEKDALDNKYPARQFDRDQDGAVGAFSSQQHLLELLNRYENREDRAYHRALERLQNLQKNANMRKRTQLHEAAANAHCE